MIYSLYSFPLLFITIIFGRWSQHWVRCGTLNTFSVWCAIRSWAAQASVRGMGVHIVTKTTISSSPLVVPTAKGLLCMWEKPLFCYSYFLLSPTWEIKQSEATVLCNLLVFQNILTALDQSWHPEHFFCTHCGGLFGPEGLGGLHIHFPSLKISTCKQLEII